MGRELRILHRVSRAQSASPGMGLAHHRTCQSPLPPTRPTLHAVSPITPPHFPPQIGDVVSNMNLRPALAAHLERRSSDKASIMTMVG